MTRSANADGTTSEPRDAPLRTVVFTDLDDTLFRTARKTPPDELARAHRAARANNGRDSFATPRQRALLDWLDPARCVPVTARGSEAFSRVLLAFAGPAAVLANGAVVLGADGAPDPLWQEHVRCALRPVRDTLDALPERIRAEAARHDVAIRTWLVEEPGCGGVYAVAKAESDPDGGSLRALVPGLREALVDAGGDVGAEAGERAWQIHLNGNNLALLPPGLSKRSATAYLLERFRESGEVLAIGVGDSASDLPFMRLCDVWVTPSDSQIDRLCGHAPGCAVAALHEGGPTLGTKGMRANGTAGGTVDEPTAMAPR